MTDQILHEHFPDLSIMEFKILGTIAYHGEIPARYHLRSLAHKSRYREEDVMAAIEKLRLLKYIDDEKVAPKHFFRVVPDQGSNWCPLHWQEASYPLDP